VRVMTVDKAKGLDSLARAQTELATCWNRIHRCSRKASVGVHLCALGVRRAQKALSIKTSELAMVGGRSWQVPRRRAPW
jgi:hypothetical protein